MWMRQIQRKHTTNYYYFRRTNFFYFLSSSSCICIFITFVFYEFNIYCYHRWCWLLLLVACLLAVVVNVICQQYGNANATHSYCFFVSFAFFVDNRFQHQKLPGNHYYYDFRQSKTVAKAVNSFCILMYVLNVNARRLHSKNTGTEIMEVKWWYDANTCTHTHSPCLFFEMRWDI